MRTRRITPALAAAALLIALGLLASSANAASTKGTPSVDQHTRKYVRDGFYCQVGVALVRVDISQGKSDVKLADDATNARDVCDAARCLRAGHAGGFLVRADSGFVNYGLFRAILRHGGDYSIATPMRPDVRAAVEAIPEDAWQPIAYPAGSAAIAETTLPVAERHRRGPNPLPAELRMIVRRVQNHDPNDAQQPLFSDHRYFPILTSRSDEPLLTEADHRDHAKIELVIRDLKDAGLAHLPSGRMYANMAWLLLATLAHNLQRWTAILGLHERRITQHRTIRNRYLQIPGRLTQHARRRTLRLPTNWPWRTQFLTAINHLRALPNPSERRIQAHTFAP